MMINGSPPDPFPTTHHTNTHSHAEKDSHAATVCVSTKPHQQVQAAEREQEDERAAKVEAVERRRAHLVQQDRLGRAQDRAEVDAQLCARVLRACVCVCA